MTRTHQGVIRKEGHKYGLEVLEHATETRNKSGRDKPILINLDGDEIKVNSLRLYTFKMKGTRCRSCGVVGSVIYKEKSKGDKRFHLNLYAIDYEGHEVLMTKDHILPKALGGRNFITNMQPMCKPCNEMKGVM